MFKITYYIENTTYSVNWEAKSEEDAMNQFLMYFSEECCLESIEKIK